VRRTERHAGTPRAEAEMIFFRRVGITFYRVWRQDETAQAPELIPTWSRIVKGTANGRRWSGVCRAPTLIRDTSD
jgi:hypothetical protein